MVWRAATELAENNTKACIEAPDSKIQIKELRNGPIGKLKGNEFRKDNSRSANELTDGLQGRKCEQRSKWRLVYYDDFVKLRFCINMGYLIIKQNGGL